MFYGNKFLNAQPVAESFIVLEFDQNNTTNILNELYDFNTEVGYSVLTEGVKEFFKTAGDKIKAIVEKILTAIKKAITWITGKLIGFIDKLLAKLKKKRDETSSTEKAAAPAQSSSGSSSSSSSSSTNSESKEESISYYKLSPEFNNAMDKLANVFRKVDSMDDPLEELGDFDPDTASKDELISAADLALEKCNKLLDPFDKDLDEALEVLGTEKAYTLVEIKYPEYKKAILDQCIKYIEQVKHDVSTIQSELNNLHKMAKEMNDDFNEMVSDMESDMKKINAGEKLEGMTDSQTEAMKICQPAISKILGRTASLFSKSLSGIAKAESDCTKVLSKNAISMDKIVTMAQLEEIERIKASEVKPEGESN